jgi:hypothetical protein
MSANAKFCLCFLVFGLWVRLAAGQTKETPATDGNVKIQVSVNAVPVVARDSEERLVFSRGEEPNERERHFAFGQCSRYCSV